MWAEAVHIGILELIIAAETLIVRHRTDSSD